MNINYDSLEIACYQTALMCLYILIGATLVVVLPREQLLSVLYVFGVAIPILMIVVIVIKWKIPAKNGKDGDE